MANIPLASIDRPTALRLRADLLIVRVESAGTTSWVVKDPLTLEHFQFSAEEHALLDWLRELVTIAELQRRFQRKFSPRTITPDSIWDFTSRLHASGLLVSDAPGQGRELLARRERDDLRKLAFSWTSVLGIRFRGVNPDAFLTAAHNGLRWLFSPLIFSAALALIVLALSLVVGHFDEFRARLPEVSALFDWRNLPWLLVAIGGVKVLHELGHALACKHFGGEVNELGFMLLAFAPCLYCDVSDAWRLPSKWQRIAISAAGILVEVTLAAAATFVWWYSAPGVVQLLALNVMMICTVNTLAINGNPLLRYDGYYILSDLVEVPNLWQRSREALKYFCSEWIMGQPAEDDALLPARQRPWLACYAVVSKLYLTMVCLFLVWGLAKSLAPHHLQNVAYLVGLTVLGAAIVGPVTNAVGLARNPIRRGQVRRGRLAIVAAVALAASVAVLAIPVNYNVTAPMVLMPEDATRVYAAVEGTLDEILPAGTTVSRGDTIVKLGNSEKQLDLAKLEGECRLRKLKVEHLERLRGVDHEANDALPTARTALADSERRLNELQSESRRLTLTSPVSGVVIPAPRLPEIHTGEGKLPKWSGSLLDPSARGAPVEAGTLTCLVGDPKQLSAVLLVDDADVKFLQPGQHARLRVDQLPGRVVEGEVVEVSRHEAEDANRDGRTRPDLAPLFAGLIAPGHEGPHYEVRVKLDVPATGQLVIGGRGDAKVATERITIGRRMWRAVAQTFRLPI
jgi:putative peptide zinc metalloprotease protein